MSKTFGDIRPAPRVFIVLQVLSSYGFLLRFGYIFTRKFPKVPDYIIL